MGHWCKMKFFDLVLDASRVFWMYIRIKGQNDFAAPYHLMINNLPQGLCCLVGNVADVRGHIVRRRGNLSDSVGKPAQGDGQMACNKGENPLYSGNFA